jgi:hypothetical protein
MNAPAVTAEGLVEATLAALAVDSGALAVAVSEFMEPPARSVAARAQRLASS